MSKQIDPVGVVQSVIEQSLNNWTMIYQRVLAIGYNIIDSSSDQCVIDQLVQLRAVLHEVYETTCILETVIVLAGQNYEFSGQSVAAVRNSIVSYQGRDDDMVRLLLRLAMN